MKTETFITELFKAYPLSTVNDICKALFQSSFGCEHFIEDRNACTERIISEHASSSFSDTPMIEELDGSYVRLSLSIIDEGMSPSTLASLFSCSARKEPHGIVALEEKLNIFMTMIEEGKTPLNREESFAYIRSWKQQHYPAISHSDVYKQAYRPSYRLVHKDYVPYIPVLLMIDGKKKEKQSLTVAIDGHCGGGKTTLGVFLRNIYDADLVHVDDFYLQAHQRTEERYAQPGGNFDRERLEAEVLLPHSLGKDVSYHWFDCSAKKLTEDTVSLHHKDITVIEGSYSMYPTLQKYYDCSVFVDIDPDTQLRRIARRNPDLIQDFREKWIPLENRYFEAYGISEACDLIIPAQ